LAPTGNARVRLGQKTGDPSMTVAQFLYQQNRYDAARQRPLLENYYLPGDLEASIGRFVDH
jgi:hypothetical protein